MFILLKKELKKHKFNLLGLFILFVVIAISLISALSIQINSSKYITDQMNDLGFGDLTVWVNADDNIENITKQVSVLNEVESVNTEQLIYAGYSIGQNHSDNEGQLIPYDTSQYNYRFLNSELNRYIDAISIRTGEIYISPAMHSMYDISLGDQILFDITRQGEPIAFTVAGYFEDPFMGSSMIDMKSFLINQEDFLSLTNMIDNTSDFNKLARNGAMLHIFQNSNSNLSSNQFNKLLNNQTTIGNITEFIYTQSSIEGFMMIQQNMFSGFLIAFVIVLLIVSMVVIGYSITHSIELEQKDIGILKTIGFNTTTIRIIQISQYFICITLSFIVALLLSLPLIEYISVMMVTSTGLLVPSLIPYSLCLICLCSILILMIIFIILKTQKIKKISPIQTIQGSGPQLSLKNRKNVPINKNQLLFSLSIRQLLANKRKYIGTGIISIVLVLFLSMIGRINTWLGPNGEGLMNAFSVAQHDLGVQPLTRFDMQQAENIISSYANIEDTYMLAMESVRIDGVDFTANIIDDTSLLHIISGRTVQNDNEIVITEFVANDLGIEIGDSVTISSETNNSDYIIVGIYQCANEMGANLAMIDEGYRKIGRDNPYIWCYHYILSDHSSNELIMQELQNRYPMDLAVHTNSWSGLDGIVNTMHLLTYAMYGVVIIFILITVILIGSQILRSQQNDMAIYKSIGFYSHELRLSFAISFAVIVFIGALIGMIAGMLICDNIIANLVQLFGIGEFRSNLALSNTLFPVMIITFVFSGFAYISSSKMKYIALTTLIKNDI